MSRELSLCTVPCWPYFFFGLVLLLGGFNSPPFILHGCPWLLGCSTDTLQHSSSHTKAMACCFLTGELCI